MFFESKEKKQKRQEAQAAARADAEFEARYTAKQERKNIEKKIAETDKALEQLFSKAAETKSKGYSQSYQQYVQLIKIHRARKKQAEMFLYQVDAMQEMQSISANSAELLASMNAIMQSLGSISLDRSVIASTQKNFNEAQRKLDAQAASIEQFLSGMEMRIPDDGDLDTHQYQDATIDAEIDDYIAKKGIENIGTISDDGIGALKEALEKEIRQTT